MKLNQLVGDSAAVREAEAEGKLIRLPTGDGMALVFTDSLESPVECALQLSEGIARASRDGRAHGNSHPGRGCTGPL